MEQLKSLTECMWLLERSVISMIEMLKMLESMQFRHLGLTLEELKAYRELKSFVAYMGSVISKTNNERNEK